MGTAPSGYQTPKTNWAAGNIPTASDFNRIEGNIYAVEEGSRTIDPTQAPAGNSGSLRQFLDWLANRIKAITGKNNWYDAPSKTLEDLNTHINAAAPHSGHETPSGAQAKANAALAAAKGYTDQEIAKVANDLASHKNDNTNPHQVTKIQIGLENVDNVKQMPISGGTFTGIVKAQNNTSYTTAQIRNIIFSTDSPSGGNNGDIWLKYE